MGAGRIAAVCLRATRRATSSESDTPPSTASFWLFWNPMIAPAVSDPITPSAGPGEYPSCESSCCASLISAFDAPGGASGGVKAAVCRPLIDSRRACAKGKIGLFGNAARNVSKSTGFSLSQIAAQAAWSEPRLSPACSCEAGKVLPGSRKTKSPLLN